MWHKTVLILLSLANILNIFVERAAESGERGFVQVINGLMALIAGLYICFHLYRIPKLLRFVVCMMFLMLVYFLYNLFFVKSQFFIVGDFIRFFTSLVLLLFFYKYKERQNTIIFIQIFVITYIAQIGFKILTGERFGQIGMEEGDIIGGGDASSIGLALIIPLVFMSFKGRYSLVLFLLCCFLVLCSLRRTSIVAIALSLPFIWDYIKSYINKRVILISMVVSIVVVYNLWHFIGDAVTSRVLEMFQGTEKAGVVTYGSGRSEFWTALIKDYWKHGSWFLGYGLGSVSEFYQKHYPLPLSHAHSDVLELLYTYGILGLVIWLGGWIGLIFSVKRKKKCFETKRLLYCSCSLYVFVAITSGTILRAQFFPLVIALGILINRSFSNESCPINKLQNVYD